MFLRRTILFRKPPMRLNVLLAGFAAFSISAAALAQTPAEFTPERFRAHVAFLADDLLEGREAGTRGYDLAAHYVATRFEALGLVPPVAGGWMQPVTFVEYRTEGEPKLSVGGETFVQGREILVRPSPEAGALDLKAPVVFAGYGLDMPARGFDDYAGLDARGKIVVVLGGVPEGLPSDVAAHLAGDKAEAAARAGAVGLVTVRRRAEAERMPWERIVRFAGRPGTTWVAPDGTPFSTAPGLRFSATVDSPVAEALFAGAERSLDDVLEAAARPGERPRGFALPTTARIERENARREFTSPNVLALLPGSDPALADEVVVLTAHLDGVGMVDDPAPGADAIRNGAMDNATGIAALLETARAMAAAPERPRRPVLFAAVTAEEKGLLGAEYLAHNLPVPGRAVAVVNLDMPVLTYDFEDVIAFGAEHSTMGPIVARAAERMGVEVIPDPLPQEGLFTRSDHYRFVQQGVPSVFLMTGFGGEGRARFTEFLRGPYHGPGDDMSLPFDWGAGAKFARLNYLIAREIADADRAPLWYRDSFFGAVYGGDAPRAGRQAAAAASE